MENQNSGQEKYEHLLSLLRRAGGDDPRYLFIEKGRCTSCRMMSHFTNDNDNPFDHQPVQKPHHYASCPVPELLSLIYGGYEYVICRRHEDAYHRISSEDYAVEETNAKLRGHA